jgi:hypothetical protein
MLQMRARWRFLRGAVTAGVRWLGWIFSLVGLFAGVTLPAVLHAWLGLPWPVGLAVTLVASVILLLEGTFRFHREELAAVSSAHQAALAAAPRQNLIYMEPGAQIGTTHILNPRMHQEVLPPRAQGDEPGK